MRRVGGRLPSTTGVHYHSPEPAARYGSIDTLPPPPPPTLHIYYQIQIERLPSRAVIWYTAAWSNEMIKHRSFSHEPF